MLADELVVVVPADLWLGVTSKSGGECDGFHFLDMCVDNFFCESWFGVFFCLNDNKKKNYILSVIFSIIIISTSQFATDLKPL